MNKTLLILRHEFVTLVKRKGFIVMTVVFPLIGFAAIGIYLIIQGVGTAEREAPLIGYVDEVGQFSEYTSQGDLTFISFDTYEEATEALRPTRAWEPPRGAGQPSTGHTHGLRAAGSRGAIRRRRPARCSLAPGFDLSTGLYR